MSEIEVPQRQQIDKDTPINLRDVVVGEIDGVKLIQFGEGFFGNIDEMRRGRGSESTKDCRRFRRDSRRYSGVGPGLAADEERGEEEDDREFIVF